MALPLGFAGFYGAVWVIDAPGWRVFALLQPLVGALVLAGGYAAWRVGLRRYASTGT